MSGHTETFANCFYYTATCPFKFVGESHLKDSILKRSSVLSLSFFGSILLSLLSIFHIARVAYLFFEFLPPYIENCDFLRFTFHGGWILCWALIFSQHLASISIDQEMVQLSYGLVHFGQVIEQRFHKKDLFNRVRKFRKLLLITGLSCMLATMIVVNGPLFYLFRNEPWHFGSNVYRLLNHQSYFPMSETWSFLLALIPENLYMMWAWGAFIVHMDINFMFLQLYSETLRYFTRLPYFHLIPLEIRSYSELRILSWSYNVAYGHYYIAPITTFQQLLTTLGIFVTIKFLRHLNSQLIVAVGILTTLITGSIMFLIVQFTGNVYEDSVNFHQSLRRKLVLEWSAKTREGKSFSKNFHKRVAIKTFASFKVNAVKYGMFYEVRRITSLLTLSVMADMTINALLSVDDIF